MARGDKVGPSALHADAVAVSAFRVLPSGEGRAYTISQAPSGRRAVERLLRMARAFGYVEEAGWEGESYAMLDILDANDDIVQDFHIPTAEAFRWWKRHLHLRVQREPNDAR